MVKSLEKVIRICYVNMLRALHILRVNLFKL